MGMTGMKLRLETAGTWSKFSFVANILLPFAGEHVCLSSANAKTALRCERAISSRNQLRSYHFQVCLQREVSASEPGGSLGMVPVLVQRSNHAYNEEFRV